MTTLVTGEYRVAIFCGKAADTERSILEYQSREDADRAAKQLDGKDLRGQTVRVVVNNDVRPRHVPYFPFLTIFPSVVPITTVGMNVVMTVTVITVIGIVRSALPTAVNARAPHHPAVMPMTVGQGPPHAGTTTTVVRLVTTKGRTVVPRNPILVKPVMNAAGTKGSGMKRMTDMKTVLPGTLMAMRPSGKTNPKELPEEVRWNFPLRIWRKRLFWRRIHVSDALWFTYLPVFRSVARHSLVGRVAHSGSC